MKTQKISPIAQCLTKNKAITKRDGNLWLFYNKEGALLGNQIKTNIGNSTMYIRNMFVNGFDSVYIEIKHVMMNCTYYKTDKNPLGLGILPVEVNMLSQSIDVLKDTLHTIETKLKLVSKHVVVARDENTEADILEIQKPIMYQNKVLQDEIFKGNGAIKVRIYEN